MFRDAYDVSNDCAFQKIQGIAHWIEFFIDAYRAGWDCLESKDGAVLKLNFRPILFRILDLYLNALERPSIWQGKLCLLLTHDQSRLAER